MRVESPKARFADLFSGESRLLDAPIAVIVVLLGVATIVSALGSFDLSPSHIFLLGGSIILVSVGYGIVSWHKPERAIIRSALGGLAGGLATWVLVRAIEAPGKGTVAAWPARLVAACVYAAPRMLVLFVPMLITIWVVSLLRRQLLQRSLDEAVRDREREAAARQVAESRAALLQLQIQPHFLFNTLAALRQWVDTSDPRAAPLLRNLTGFLRDSTELLGCADVPLGDECAMVRHYLEIMQARLGERLTFNIDVDAACHAVSLPPGIVMTLVENAIRHGIEPSLRGGNVALEGRCRQGSLDLHVRDSGVGLGAHWQDGIGLANCRQRLRHRFHAAATLTVSSRSDAPGADAHLHLSIPTAPATP